MKKTMKRFLTTALAMTMLLTMMAVPASAAELIEQTDVLMSDDMSVAPTGWRNSAAGWNNGTRWGYEWNWELDNPQIVIENGNTVIKSDSAKTAGANSIIRKNAFVAAPVEQSKSTVTITYDVKTGGLSDAEVIVYNYANAYMMSSYNAKTGEFAHRGWQGAKFTLSENTEYALIHKFFYTTATKNHALEITVVDKAGNASITNAAGESVSSAKSTVYDFYKDDITTLSYLDYKVLYNTVAAASGTELFTYQHITVENKYTRDDARKYVLMNQHMSTANHPSNRLTTGTTYGDLLKSEDAYPLFKEGKEWGAVWAPAVGASVNDAGLNFGTATTMTASGDWQCLRKIFTLNPASDNRDMRFTYDITTGTKTATNLTVRSFIGTPANEQMFLYDAKNCTVQFVGTNIYYAWNSDTEVIQLAENTDYTFVIDFIWDDATNCYDLVCQVLNGDLRVGNIQLVDNYTLADGNADWERTGFYAKWSEAATDAVTALTVKNIKIEETAEKTITFDNEYNYTNERVLLDEKTADLDLKNDVVALTSDEYTSGEKWGVYDNGISATSAFKVENGYLYCKAYDNQYGKFAEISKKFEPIKDGETLTLKTTIDPNGLFKKDEMGTNDWCGLALGLESSTMNNGMDAFLLNTRQWITSALWTFARTKVTGAEGGKYQLGNAAAGAITLADQYINPTNKGEFYCSGGIDFTLTLAPSATAGKYTATVTAVNPYATFMSEEARTKTATKEIDKALALSFDTIRLNTTLASTQKAETVGKWFAGLKDIKLTAKDASKTALTEGVNTIYLPVTNITEAPVDYQLLAVVYQEVDGEEEPTYYAVSEEYTANASEYINLSVDVEVTNAETQKVKLYVFDNTDTLVPYTAPITSAK